MEHASLTSAAMRAAIPDAVAASLGGLCDGRPLVVFDLETTGTDRVVDRIIEIGAVRLFPGAPPSFLHERVNPGRRIPKESSEIHGITNEDVAGAPPFVEIADRVEEFFRDADLAGYSLRAFDLPVLTKEFDRAGRTFSMEGRRIVDAQAIFFKKEPRDLSAALRFFVAREHTGAHSALADAIASAEVLAGELARYADLPRSIAGLHRFSLPWEGAYVDPDKRFVWRDGAAVFAFGEFRGHALEGVAKDHPEFLAWILNRDFSAETKRIIRDAQRGVFPARG